jgi:hypothetical protein
MPLKKLKFTAGVNKENTRYTSENGWYDCDKIRFRQGTPEKIGGWSQISSQTFIGYCRSLWSWATLAGLKLVGVGTNSKFYIESGGYYYDITPIRSSIALTNPFSITNNSSTVSVSDATSGYINGDYVTYYGSTAIGNVTILGEYQITYSSSGTTYTINLDSPVSIAIGSPVVFTSKFKLANTTPVTLATTGSLPSPFVVGTTYYVVSTSGYTFSLAATSGGTAINSFTDNQSGVHTVTAKATSTSASGGGSVTAVYQINTGPEVAQPLTGWGASYWGSGGWGSGQSSSDAMRLWSQNNFGQDLIFGPRGGPLYYWNATVGVAPSTVTITIASPAVITSSVGLANTTAISFDSTGSLPTGLTIGVTYYVVNASGNTFNVAATSGGTPITTTGSQSGTQYLSTRGIAVSSLSGASNVPTSQNYMLVSDASRFVFCFGTNDYLSTTFDPMLIRWSDANSVTEWTASATTSSRSIRLSHGSEIVTALQTRQEIVVWTDSSLYSIQFLKQDPVWGSQILADNISIISENAASLANNIVFWMGNDKFYMYDGRVQTLKCDLRQFIYSDINLDQADQIFSGTNEGFNEVWWFYCTASSTTIDRYVVYNYAEEVWYYGSMARTAWLDSGLVNSPLAATYSKNLVNHEIGYDNNETATTVPIEAYITSAEFDLDDGHMFSFVWRVLPDITFRGSTTSSPSAVMYLKPMKNSGSGYTTPASVGGVSSSTITRTAVLPIEAFTGQIYTRVRGRQMAIELRSTGEGVSWQLGSPRLDIRPDGRR